MGIDDAQDSCGPDPGGSAAAGHDRPVGGGHHAFGRAAATAASRRSSRPRPRPGRRQTPGSRRRPGRPPRPRSRRRQEGGRGQEAGEAQKAAEASKAAQADGRRQEGGGGPEAASARSPGPAAGLLQGFLKCMFRDKPRPGVQKASTRLASMNETTGEDIDWAPASKYARGSIIVSTPERNFISSPARARRGATASASAARASSGRAPRNRQQGGMADLASAGGDDQP